MKFSDFVKCCDCNLKVFYNDSHYLIYSNSNNIGDYPLEYYGFLLDKTVRVVKPHSLGIFPFLSIYLY